MNSNFQLSHFQIGSVAPEVEMHDFLMGGGGFYCTQDHIKVDPNVHLYTHKLLHLYTHIVTFIYSQIIDIPLQDIQFIVSVFSKIKLVDKFCQTPSPIHIQYTRHETNQTFNLTNRKKIMEKYQLVEGLCLHCSALVVN